MRPGELARRLSAAAPASPAAPRGRGGGPPVGPDPEPMHPAEARDRLRTAIAALREETTRHTALLDAQNRAQDERREAETALADADAALHDLQRSEPQRIAYSFVNNEALNLGVDIGTAEAELRHHRETAEHIQQIQTALEAEIAASEHRLQILRRPVREDRAAVVTNAGEFNALFAQRDKAWAWLRTLNILFAEICSALEGLMPEHLRIRFLAEEPLERGMSY